VQWMPALILVLPAALVAYAAWRPGPFKIALALLVTAMLDLATFAAFWLQGEWRSTGDTIRLIAFVAIPAGIITALTVTALVRGLSARRRSQTSRATLAASARRR